MLVEILDNLVIRATKANQVKRVMLVIMARMVGKVSVVVKGHLVFKDLWALMVLLDLKDYQDLMARRVRTGLLELLDPTDCVVHLV
ncbi:hypothetical protein [Salmonella sp. s54412]|uniref:hypothetical protein n=2 Tax=Salmonella TaxID=590 RepID=UPI003754ADD0